MLEQLQHLLRANSRSYINIRVVPVEIGAHPATSGSFCLLEFLEFRPIVYLADETGGRFLEEESHIVTYQKLIAAVSAVALDANASADLIRRAAARYGDGELAPTIKPKANRLNPIVESEKRTNPGSNISENGLAADVRNQKSR